MGLGASHALHDGINSRERVSDMLKKRIQDMLLTLFGVAALIVYVLACRPSFSPDGSKILFPIMNHEADTASAALYDLKNKTLETIFAAPQYLAVQWLPDGKQALVNGDSFVAILPLGSSNPVRFIPLKEKLDDGSLVFTPPVVGKHQFILSNMSGEGKDAKGNTVSVKGNVLFKVNLETMEVQKVPQGNEEMYVFAKGNQLYYIAALETDTDTAYELGRLDPEKLSRNAILRLKRDEYGEIFGFAAPNNKGNRFALTAKGEGVLNIQLFRDNALERTIPVTGMVMLGNLEWSPDEQTLYAAFSRTLNKDHLWQYGILEVPVNGGSTREIALFKGKKEDGGPGLTIFQIALSADGRRIAATSTCLEDIGPDENALYLVDLKSSKQDVTKVAIPRPAGKDTTAEKKGK